MSEMASTQTPNRLEPKPAALPNTTIIPKLEPRRRRPVENAQPRPVTPAFPGLPDLSKLEFQTPSRRILTKSDHEMFLASPSSRLIQAWIFGLTDAVAGVPCSAVKEDGQLSKPMVELLRILDELEAIVEKAPPNEQGGSRFGNKAFRDFLDEAKLHMPQWHKNLGLEREDAITEVSAYLAQSFGNRMRIDYGSGHELNFMIWLLCLYQLRVFEKSDFKTLVLRVFKRYLVLMQKLQMAYYLEPAGSHGVWGLDDYQFLPFLFGAAQLLEHPYLGPKSIHNELALEENSMDYLYLFQVTFVNSTKTVKGLRWHSPMLDDISSAKSWSKIEAGMRRMFMAEVLGKLPVMQHFLFGSLVPAVEGMSREDEAGLGSEENEPEGGELCLDHGKEGHKHGNAIGWNDCCGIKVPSGIAAGVEARKKLDGGLRRIPFD
ncbi:Serine/threonine-protein phosphatase 2A activator 2 [Ceratocystis fimbriata CBS 114723]|uniref:Serine/threonine-protein phosphatase 2A activator n=2 Tax=Ceratocystis TaxID=5157 RepID=A0A2C5X9C2_9PEZI|nr:Serine/threonine-protein phosphatase 2A activator 2 [Ceratocystis fimbriata CBS 114723]